MGDQTLTVMSIIKELEHNGEKYAARMVRKAAAKLGIALPEEQQ